MNNMRIELNSIWFNWEQSKSRRTHRHCQCQCHLWLRLAMSGVSGWMVERVLFCSVQFLNQRQSPSMPVQGQIEREREKKGERTSTYIHFVEHHNIALELVEMLQMQLLLLPDDGADVTWLGLMTLQNAFAFAFCFAFALALLMCMVIVKFDYQCHSKYTRW